MYQQKRSGFNKGFYRRRGHRGRGSTRGDRRRKGFRRPFGSQGFRQRTSVHPYTEPQREQENESLMKVKIESVDASTLLKPMSIEKSALIAPGQPSTVGTQVKLLTNYFPLKSTPTGPFYQYFVQFSPEIENPRLAKHLLSMHDDSLFNGICYVFDGVSVLYTQKPLRNDLKEKIQVKSNAKDNTEYQIKIHLSTTLSSSNITPAVIQLFNTMYRHALIHLKLQQIGKHHYNMNHYVEVPKHRVKVIPGLMETIYMTSNGILFNVDVIYKTLRTDTVLHLIYDMKRKYRYNYKQRITAEIANSIVLCLYNNKTVHIDGIEWRMDPTSSFKTKKGTKITFIEYFKKQYNVTIKDRTQPLLIHRPKGSEKHVEYFIPELCSLTGITESMRKDRKCMKDVRTSAGLVPADRAKKIFTFVRESVQNKQFAKVLNDWQFEIDPRLLQLNGRLLERQTILFGQNIEQKANDEEEWKVRERPLYRPVSIQQWTVIQPTDSEDVTKNFMKTIFMIAKPLGIELGEPTILTAENDEPFAYKNALKTIKSETQFVMIILPNNVKERYDIVKKELTLTTPIPSQCVNYETIANPRRLPSKVTKIVVQMAVKTGGAPWTLNYSFPPNQKMMIVGLDVYHSGERVTRTKNSIVCFTATMDDTLTKYYSRVLINKPGKELVNSLQPVLEDALNKFKELNSQYPNHIVFYRDGIGEGQVKDALKTEVRSVEKAIESLQIDKKPGLCFVVVLKRIHTRLFREDQDTLKNPLPGTVVDTEITNKDALEFFLVSQSITQGTATPTRYQCIYNSSEFTSVYLQNLTYMLCHYYFNWFGSIRVPAPCMYAHKLAYLVGQSLEREHPQHIQSDLLYYL